MENRRSQKIVEEFVKHPCVLNTKYSLFCCLIFCHFLSLFAIESPDSIAEGYKNKVDSLNHVGDSLSNAYQDDLAIAAYEAAAFYQRKAAVHHQKIDEWKAYMDCVLDLSNIRFQDPMLVLRQAKDTLLQYFCEEDYVFALLNHKLAILYYNVESNYDSALQYNRKALAIRKKHLASNDPQIAHSYFNIGLIYKEHKKNATHSNKMYADSALYFFEEALSIRNQSQVISKEILARNCVEIGKVHLDNREYSKAYHSYQQALANLDKVDSVDSIELAVYYRQLGLICEKIGDYQQTIHYYRAAKSIFQEDSLSFVEDLGRIYNDLGIIHDRLEKYDSALEYYQRSLAVLDQINENQYLKKDIADVYNQIALAYDKKKDYDTAIENYNQAIKLYEKLPLADIQTNLIITYSNLANTYKHQGKYQQAFEEIQKVIEIRKKNTDDKNLAGSYENLADIQFAKGEIEAALQSYQQSILCLMPHFIDSNYYQNPLLDAKAVIGEPYDLLRVLRLKAETLKHLATQKEKEKNLTASLQCYQKADTLVHQLRKSFQAKQSKYFLAKEVIPIYEGAIEVALELEQPHLAFQFAEKNKAAVLVSLVKQQKIEQFGNVPITFLQNERKLQSKIAETQLKLYEIEVNHPQTNHAYWDSLARFQREIEKLHQQIEQNHPQYYAYQHAPITITIPYLQENLPPKTAIVSFFEGQQNRYSFTITPDTFWVQQQLIDTVFHQSFEVFRNLMDELEVWDSQKYAESAFTLYEHLLEFPLKKIEEQNVINELIIIPDGKLNYLAFEALIRERLEGMEDLRPTEIPYVLHDYAIGYSYSAQLVADDFSSDSFSFSEGDFGGWAANENTLLSPYSKKIPLDSIWRKKKLASLRYVNQEVREIGAALGGNVWENATKEDFVQHCSKHNILHLSMHGIVDEAQILNAGLVFAVPKDSSSNLLNIAEIYDLNLQNVDLTVLSACNTAYGEILPGEGIMSLSRAFTYSGCKSLVTSLWSVSDKSTHDIMTAFYKYLEIGENKAVAMQKAKISYIKSTNPSNSLPKFWAGSILLGNNASIASNYFLKHQIYIWILLAIIAACFLFVRFISLTPKTLTTNS